MSFSTATITHTFSNADQTPASGSIEFTLSDLMTNGTGTLVPASITANLNSSGQLSQPLTSNVDPATWSLTGTATSGSFELQFTTGSVVVTTAQLAYNCTAAQVQAAVAALPGLAGVTCTGGPLGSASVTLAGLPGDTSIVVVPSVTGGTVTVALTSAGTVPAAPQNSQWRVDLRILGAAIKTFFIVVPAGGGTVDLFSLIPNQQQVA